MSGDSNPYPVGLIYVGATGQQEQTDILPFSDDPTKAAGGVTIKQEKPDDMQLYVQSCSSVTQGTESAVPGGSGVAIKQEFDDNDVALSADGQLASNQIASNEWKMTPKSLVPDEVDELFDMSEVEDDEGLYSTSEDFSSDDEPEVERKGAENAQLSANSSDEEEDSVHITVQGCWTDNDADLPDFPFSGSPGVNINLPPDCKPMDVFTLFFDDHLIKEVVRLVNKRASEIRDSTPKTRSHAMTYWKPVDEEEIEVFFGLTFLMGQVKMPTYKHYWSNGELFYHPIFGATMSRVRYELILRSMRLYDPETACKTDSLYKVNLIIGHFLNKMAEIYHPNRNLSIDEAMVLCHGRLSFRQYIPNKRDKCRIKFYELCTTNGVVLNVLVDRGKGTVATNDEKSRTEAVVLKLMENYLDKGHALYMDSFYNSVKLTKLLGDQNTYVCGTLRKNRKGNPTAVTKAKLKKGQAIWKRNNDVIITKWKDKSDVLMITNMHKHLMVETTTKQGVVVSKPKVILDYNSHMSGTDRCDQMILYYATPRKSIRWYIKVMLYLFDIMLWNSACFYKSLTKKQVRYLQFRDEICKTLIKGRSEARRIAPKRTSTSHINTRLQKGKRCRICYKDGKRKETVYGCANCPKKPALCPGKCFQTFHENII